MLIRDTHTHKTLIKQSNNVSLVFLVRLGRVKATFSFFILNYSENYTHYKSPTFMTSDF